MTRRHPSLVCLVVLLGSALLLAGASLGAPATAHAQDLDELMKSVTKPTLDPVISGFGPGDVRKTETQRAQAAQLALGSLGATLGRRTDTDLDALQRLIDGGFVARDDVAMQQALGVVLGDALARDLPTLRWAVVDDRFGHSRMLRYRDSTSMFFPVTMISKRMGMGDPVDVRALYEQVVGDVERLEQERAESRRRTQGRR